MDWSLIQHFFFTINPWLGLVVFILIGYLLAIWLIKLGYYLPIRLFHVWRAECQEYLTEYTELDERIKTTRQPKQFCLHCAAPLLWYAKLPIIGYFLRVNCGHRLPMRHLVLGIVYTLIPVLTFIFFGISAKAAFTALWLFALVLVIDTDIKFNLIPDAVVLSMLWLGLIANYFSVFVDLHTAVLGAIVGYLSLWAMVKIFSLIFSQTVIGQGDFKFFAMIGAWLGWQSLLPIFLLALASAFIIGMVVIIAKKSRQSTIPFAPFLAFGALVMLCYRFA